MTIVTISQLGVVLLLYSKKRDRSHRPRLSACLMMLPGSSPEL